MRKQVLALDRAHLSLCSRKVLAGSWPLPELICTDGSPARGSDAVKGEVASVVGGVSGRVASLAVGRGGTMLDAGAAAASGAAGPLTAPPGGLTTAAGKAPVHAAAISALPLSR